MIEGLAAALGVKLSLTGEEIADVLWLVAHIQTESIEATDAGAPSQPKDNQLTPDRPVPPTKHSQKDDKESSKESYADIYAEEEAPGSTDLSFQVPDARSLREPLELARALKPLLRRVPSGTSQIMDEAATVQRITDERVWMPVLKPSLEPWLDLVLIVDESPSMLIWQRTVLEFKRVLERYGVFRNVSTWSISEEKRSTLRLRPGIGGIGQNQRPHSPSELLDPSGRRLILIASDCVADFWKDGTLLPVLKLWAESGPMAIAQMLPQWLWERTALRSASSTEFLGLRPGMTNQTLAAKPLSRRSKVNLNSGIKVPIVTLQSEEFQVWASMLAGKGGNWAKGAVFAPIKENSKRQPIRRSALNSTPDNLTAEERIKRFRITASPMGRKLAGLLAAAPVINLPVVRILQDRLLQQSKQVHVAEVFLGGLLEQVTKANVGTASTAVQFRFFDGVRDALLESVPKSEVINGFNEVSAFVAENLGLSLEEFVAVIRNPETSENEALALQARPFAMITTQILKRLGGSYNAFAEEIESALAASSLSNQTVQSSNPFSYQVGGSMPFNHPSYVTRQADSELYALCRAGEFAYVLAPRFMGKSSLRVQVMWRLQQDGVSCVVMDLQTIGISLREEQWFAGMIDRLVQGFDLEPEFDFRQWWRDLNESLISPPQRFSLFIEEVLLQRISQPIVIFIDEIDAILRLEYAHDFLAMLRSLYEARAHNDDLRRLSFVLVGCATTNMLIDAQYIQSVELTDFSFKEALPLAAGLAPNINDAQQILRWILNWTGGHPCLTQELCSAIYAQEQERWTELAVADAVRNMSISTSVSTLEGYSSLRFVKDMLLRKNILTNRNSDDVLETLTLYREILRDREQVIDNEESMLIKTHLKLSGVIKKASTDRNAELVVRNQIYKTVFDEAWVNQQISALAPIAKTILLLSTNPGSENQSQLDEKIRMISANLQRFGASDRFNLKSYVVHRPQDIQRVLLDEEPQILHLLNGADGISLENDQGFSTRLPTDSLAGLFSLFSEQIECVVLDKCYDQGQANAISQHIDTVVAIGAALEELPTIRFITSFYDGLGAGRNFEFAYKLGCNAISLSDSLSDVDESLHPILLQRKQGTQNQSSNETLSAEQTFSPQTARIFIAYKRDADPDEHLAMQLREALSQKYNVFTDQDLTIGASWADAIDDEIRQADFVIVLLSERAVESEMILHEVRFAHQTAQQVPGKAKILPVRVTYQQAFPNSLGDYLNSIQWFSWRKETDTSILIQELSQIIESKQLQENGLEKSLDSSASLQMPAGTMEYDSSFYIERNSDRIALDAIQRQGVTVTIKGPRQVGKSSLLAQIMHAATSINKQVVFLDFQLFDKEVLRTADAFYPQFCRWITEELELPDRVEEYWENIGGNIRSCTRYMQAYILEEVDGPLVLAMDEVDRVFDTDYRSDFFSMLRSWHNNRALPTYRVWRQLDLVIVTSTSPYSLIGDLHQSPFNVGRFLTLEDFTAGQVHQLNQQYGAPFSLHEEEALMDLVHGHPYLVQRALNLVATEEMTSTELLNQAAFENGPFAEHLMYHLFLIRDKPEQIAGLLEVIDTNQCTDRRISHVLQGAGLVIEKSDEVVPRCKLYADYFRAHLK